jgi:hypothetical protein
MKKIIRTGVFETNSSSSHSLSVADANQDFVIDTIYPDQNGVITVHDQQFGWEWMKYNDAMTKLAYLFQDQGAMHGDLIKEAVMEQTGADDVVFIEEDGYIDHDSVGTTSQVVGSKDQIKNFVFNKNSWLFTGNDNGTPDPTFYDVPEFKDGKMILPEYTHELVIHGLKKTTKFQSCPDQDEIDQGIQSLIEYDTLVDEHGEIIQENSIYWQISRPRDRFYKMDWGLHQDFSKNRILFVKEGDERWRKLEEKSRTSPDLKDKPYYEKAEWKTEEALKMEGLIQIVEFEIKEL